MVAPHPPPPCRRLSPRSTTSPPPTSRFWKLGSTINGQVAALLPKPTHSPSPPSFDRTGIGTEHNLQQPVASVSVSDDLMSTSSGTQDHLDVVSGRQLPTSHLPFFLQETTLSAFPVFSELWRISRPPTEPPFPIMFIFGFDRSYFAALPTIQSDRVTDGYKVQRRVKRFKGVKDVKVSIGGKKLSVFGKVVDRPMVEDKTHVMHPYPKQLSLLNMMGLAHSIWIKGIKNCPSHVGRFLSQAQISTTYLFLRFISICLANLDWLEDRDKFFADDSVHRFKFKLCFCLWFMLLACTIYPFPWGPEFYEIANSFFTQISTCFTTDALVKTLLLFSEKQRSPPASPKSASLQMFLGKRCSGSLVLDLTYHGGISSNLDTPMWLYLCVNWIVYVFVILGVSSSIACGAVLLLARSSMTTPLNQIWSSSQAVLPCLESLSLLNRYCLVLFLLFVRWSYPYLLLLLLP